jgi:hypothetical protein
MLKIFTVEDKFEGYIIEHERCLQLYFFRSLKTLPVKGKKGEVFRHPDIPPDVNEDTVNNNNYKNKKTGAAKTIKI